jgi:hypothetical protein
MATILVYSPYSGTTWQETWREKSPGDLSNQFDRIVRALEAAAPPIAASVAVLRQKAEEEHQRWLAQLEARRRDEQARKEREAREERERNRTAARKKSHDDLLASIEHWAWVRRVHEFFTEVEQQMTGEMLEHRRVALQERLAMARAMIGKACSARGNSCLRRTRASGTGLSPTHPHRPPGGSRRSGLP